MRRLTYVRLLVGVVVLALCVACGDQERRRARTLTDDAMAMVGDVAKTGAFDRADGLIDSLEAEGALSAAVANGMRGTVCIYQRQYRKAEFYLKKAVAGDALLEESPRYFVNMSSMLAGVLMPKQDYEEAIAVATRAYAVAREQEEKMDAERVAALLNTIGQCQVALGRLEEGEKSLVQSFQMQGERAAADTVGIDTRNWLLFALNATIAYMNGRYYAEAEPWMNRLEEALDSGGVATVVDSAQLDLLRGRVGFMRADALANTGKRVEAEAAYRRALATEYGSSADGKIDGGSYLEAIGRWREAAAAYVTLDSLMQARGVPMTLANMQNLYSPQFRTCLKAGQWEQAIGVASRMCDALDSAIVWQKRDDSAELATIYETQEKEAKIAEQEASLSSQRLIATIVVSLLVVVFLVWFIIHRNKVARRLNLEHQRLLRAHDLLGEANRRLEAANLQLVQKNDDLLVANARAEESSRMKTNFIEQISHEIRTPLNILSGFTQIAIAPGVMLSDEEREEINRGVIENTNRITGLVNKMLELSDASSQTVIERADRVSASQVARAAIEDVGICQAAHLTFELIPQGGAEAAVLLTNRRQAVRALALLLDNARKFTRPAEASVDVVEEKAQRVSLRLHVRETEGAKMLAFVVEDTGIGIPPEERERIFEKFVQLDDYYDGTGIGLTLARSIARRLGGDIVLDTDYTEGARFVLTLPVEECADSEGTAERVHQ